MLVLKISAVFSWLVGWLVVHWLVRYITSKSMLHLFYCFSIGVKQNKVLGRLSSYFWQSDWSIFAFGTQPILLYQRRNMCLVCASICSVLVVHHEFTVALGSTNWRKRMCIPICHKQQLLWMLCSFTSQLGCCTSQFILVWVVKKDIEGKHFWQDWDMKAAVDHLVQILSPYLSAGIIHERQTSNWFADCMEKWWACPLFLVLDMCWSNKYHVTFT